MSGADEEDEEEDDDAFLRALRLVGSALVDLARTAVVPAFASRPRLAAAARPTFGCVASEGGDVPIAELKLASCPNDGDEADGGDKPVGGESVIAEARYSQYG